MIRLIPIAAASVLVGLAASAAALPPAPEVAVLILSPERAPPGMIDASEGLLAQAAPDHGGGWFRRAEPVFTSADFEACEGYGGELEPCIRSVLAERGAAELDGPPTVVVLVGPGPGFSASWTCVGVGEAPRLASNQRIVIDFMRWRAEGADPAAASAAAGCITYAASESGW